MNETEYLEKQAADSRAAVEGTARWIAHEMEQVVDPRRLWRRARAYLWVWGAAVAAAGFAGSALAGRRHTESNGGDGKADAAAPPPKQAAGETVKRTKAAPEGILPLVGQLLSLARPVITAVAAVASARAEANRANGQSESAPPKKPRSRKARKRL